jgi:hypothetical protein
MPWLLSPTNAIDNLKIGLYGEPEQSICTWSDNAGSTSHRHAPDRSIRRKQSLNIFPCRYQGRHPIYLSSQLAATTWSQQTPMKTPILFRGLVKSQFSPISPNSQAAARPSSSVFSIFCGWSAYCTWSWRDATYRLETDDLIMFSERCDQHAHKEHNRD